MVGATTLVIWLGLWLAHGGFWRIDQELVPAAPAEWPSVTVVIPARNEAAVIGETLRSIWSQEYPGELRVVVVDDHSDDETAAEAWGGTPADCKGRLAVLGAEPFPGGWTGKVWAMEQGVTRGIPVDAAPRYVLFSDADISHGHGAVRELVARAEVNQLDLTSFMVRLQCRSAAERLMIPAFVFFFRLLYPFRRVNDPRHPLAGAAGGTMLVRHSALERIGGMAAIRHEIIDDCSLAHEIKRGGHRIWLGLSHASYSTRGYGTLREIVMMIARTAYTQLGYSPLRLLGCVLGLGLTFLAPPLLVTTGSAEAGVLGSGAWLVMTLLYLPMVRFYGVSPASALLLPGVACVYLYATALSAWRHHRGKGGWWKGRSQSPGT
ncbi:MAG: glycosyltransferase [Actinomycetota bacterium]